jgi:hypothetical protein
MKKKRQKRAAEFELEPVTPEEQEIFDAYDEIFYFLPPRGGFAVNLVGLPAVFAAGITEDRFFEIVEEGFMEPFEEELFTWAYKMLSLLMRSLTEQGTPQGDAALV